MPWFKVDDRTPTHPKTLEAGLKAMGLWCMAGAWSMGQLTDGFVPAGAVTMLGGTKADALKLVNAQMWDVVDGGYRFHDWADYQPSAESIEAERLAARERMKRARSGKRSGEHLVNSTRSSDNPSPSPSPIPLDVTNVIQSSPLVDAGADGIDQDSVLTTLMEKQLVEAQRLGFDLPKVRHWLEQLLDSTLDARQAVNIARVLLGKARMEPRDATAYLRSIVDRDPDSVRDAANQVDAIAA